jgi:hypothetical protein
MPFETPEQDHWMHQWSTPNVRSISTTSSRKRSTLREPPPGQGAQSPRRGATAGLKARDSRKPLTITVRYVGNGDCEWLIEARGRRFKAAGCENVHEVLARLSRAHF